ncbi:putative MFS monosaccharide transporter [Xylariomycetidae sp. FL0641]|nr:putative MFS monosaccharide transporter [Xylariomycetidae sp. FL0641]
MAMEKSELAIENDHLEGTFDLNLEELNYGPSGFRGIFSSHYVTFCASFAAIGGFLFGYDQGVISVTLTMEQFLDQFPQVADGAAGSGFYKGLMTAMIELGAFFGALNQGWISDTYSRKRTLMVAVVIFVIGSAIQTGSVSYAMLVVGRLIGGVGIGLLSSVVPLYIGEIAAPQVRGTVLVFEQLFIVFGIVVAFWITFATKDIPSYWAWQLPFLLQIFPGLLLGAGAFFLPYSPRWLAAQGREDDALASLAKLRQLPPADNRVQREWMDILAESKFQRQVLAERHPHLMDGGLASRLRLEVVSWADLFKKGCWRRTQVGAGLMFFQQFNGINALIYYSPTLFATMGFELNLQLIMSGVLNVTQLVGVLSSLYTMDRVGRKKLLLVGSAVTGISHIVIAGLVGRYSGNWPAHLAEADVSVAFLFLYMVAFGATWGPVPWAMPAEIFPSSLRAKGVGISTASNWINNFIIGLITPPLIQSTGFGAYVFFGAFCLLSFVFTWFCIPETKGKTLEEMDEVFHDRGAAADIHVKREILLEIVREKTGGTQVMSA